MASSCSPIAFNAVNKDRVNLREYEIYSVNQANYVDSDNNLKTNTVPFAMPDDVFSNGIRSLNIQQKEKKCWKKYQIVLRKIFMLIAFTCHRRSW